MVWELFQWLIAGSWPNEKLVVVSSRSKLVLIMQAPSHAANFLLMLSQFHVALVMRSQVSHKNGFILAPWCDDWRSHIVPSQWTNSSLMSVQRSHLFLLVDVPYLHFTLLCSDTEMCSFVGPTKWSNLILFANITEFLNSWSSCVPNVYWVFKCDCKNVLCWPVYKI